MGLAALGGDREAVALQERVVWAVRENALELSERLASVQDAGRAVTLLRRLAERVDVWREERAVLCRMYIYSRVPVRLWRVRPTSAEDRRELDLDPKLCVSHALNWLVPRLGEPCAARPATTTFHQLD